MRAFLTRWLDDNKELHAQLEKTESDLVAAQIAIADASMLLKEAEEGKKTTKVEMCRMKEEKDITEAKCKEAGYERNQLRNEVDELQVASTTQKKELEELWVGFATKKNDLEEDY